MKYLILPVLLLMVSCGANVDIEKAPKLDGLNMPKREVSKVVKYEVRGDAGQVSIFAKLDSSTISKRVSLPWRMEFSCTYCDLFLSVCKIVENIPTSANISVDITLDGKPVNSTDKRRNNCVEASYSMSFI